jgi:hypothetical protein
MMPSNAKTTSGYSKSRRRSLEDFEKEMAERRQLEDKGQSPQTRGSGRRQATEIVCRLSS